MTTSETNDTHFIKEMFLLSAFMSTHCVLTILLSMTNIFLRERNYEKYLFKFKGFDYQNLQ